MSTIRVRPPSEPRAPASGSAPTPDPGPVRRPSRSGPHPDSVPRPSGSGPLSEPRAPASGPAPAPLTPCLRAFVPPCLRASVPPRLRAFVPSCLFSDQNKPNYAPNATENPVCVKKSNPIGPAGATSRSAERSSAWPAHHSPTTPQTRDGPPPLNHETAPSTINPHEVASTRSEKPRTVFDAARRQGHDATAVRVPVTVPPACHFAGPGRAARRPGLACSRHAAA